MFTVVTIPTLPFHTDVTRSPTQSHAIASAGKDPARASGRFPTDSTRSLVSATTCFYCFSCCTACFFQPCGTTMVPGNPESLCAVFPVQHLFSGRLSVTELSVRLSTIWLAQPDVCFRWDSETGSVSKRKLAASLTHGMACWEKCGSSVFWSVSKLLERFWDLGRGNEAVVLGFFWVFLVEGSSNRAGSVRLHTWLNSYLGPGSGGEPSRHLLAKRKAWCLLSSHEINIPHRLFWKFSCPFSLHSFPLWLRSRFLCCYFFWGWLNLPKEAGGIWNQCRKTNLGLMRALWNTAFLFHGAKTNTYQMSV